MNANDFITTIIEKENISTPFDNTVDSARAIAKALAREVEHGVKLPANCTVKFQGENIAVATRSNAIALDTILVTVELPDTFSTTRYTAFAKRPVAVA